MEIKDQKIYEKDGEKFLIELAQKIIKEMPEINSEECAVLNTKNGYIDRVVSVEGVPLALKSSLLLKIQKIIGEKTFSTELKEEEKTENPMIRIFYKKVETIKADH